MLGLLLAAAGSAGMAIQEPPAAPKPADAAPAPIAVVELFTSEGCSSCPPADEVLSELHQRRTPGVFLVAFHVDYWDYLGWTDRFATSAATRRQRQYGEDKSLHSIYTPHMFINGAKNFVGSNRGRADRDIKLALEVNARSEVRLEVTRAEDRVTIRPAITNPPKYARIVGVLVQDGLTSSPTRGENAGKTLRHDRVARSLSAAEWSAESPALLTLDIPEDARSANLEAIVWIENTDNRAIVGAASAPTAPPAPQATPADAQPATSASPRTPSPADPPVSPPANPTPRPTAPPPAPR
jgi:hypothetical protein